MTELSGTLDGIGLFALLNFLSGLKARGRLAINDRELSGNLFFSEGRVVGATFGADSGPVALDAVGLALGQGRFTFSDDGSDYPANLDMEPAALQKHLDRLASERQRITAVLPSLDAVPLSATDGPDDQAIALDRGTLRLLLRCDGRTPVLELAREGGLLPTLKRLANLYELQLIQVVQEPRREPAAPDEIVLTRPTSVAPSEATVISRPVSQTSHDPADGAGSHPRRPWWQGEGP